MKYLLLFGTHFIVFTAWALWLVPREVFLNADMINADGSANTLHAGFHQRRTWVRFWQWLGCAVAGNLPLLATGILPAALGVAALGAMLAGFFAATFTPCLNVARGLSRLYVSFAEGAAGWPDSKLAADARAKWPDAPEQQVYSAGAALERLMYKIIWATVATYTILAGAALYVASRPAHTF